VVVLDETEDIQRSAYLAKLVVIDPERAALLLVGVHRIVPVEKLPAVLDALLADQERGTADDGADVAFDVKTERFR
jgi:hypothetical protein